MKFSDRELNNMNEINNATNELDKCGDKYCGNIITSNIIKKEDGRY